VNTKVISILLALLGQGILIAGFIVFRGSCPGNILWLNIIVSSIVYWLLASTLFGPELIGIDDPSARNVGGLGVSWVSQLMYAFFAVGFMIVCGAMGNGADGVPFKWQLIVQAGLLFLLLLGLLLSRGSTEKVAAVHHKEHQAVRGKAGLRFALADLARLASSNPDVPSAVAGALRNLSDETRYITPLSSPRAEEIEDRIFSYANRLRAALTDYGMNAREISRLITGVTGELAERKALKDNSNF